MDFCDSCVASPFPFRNRLSSRCSCDSQFRSSQRTHTTNILCLSALQMQQVVTRDALLLITNDAFSFKWICFCTFISAIFFFFCEFTSTRIGLIASVPWPCSTVHVKMPNDELWVGLCVVCIGLTWLHFGFHCVCVVKCTDTGPSLLSSSLPPHILRDV